MSTRLDEIHERGLKHLDAYYSRKSILPKGALQDEPQKKRGRPVKVHRDEDGFTLIELIVVLVIVAIIATIIIGRIPGVGAEKGNPNDRAYALLQAQGYTNITLTGQNSLYSCGCMEGESRNTGFTANGANGSTLSGCVCWGLNGTMTLHFK
jgi:prepilin-type N-terminal cleavage/methylation domain-containing protein